MAYAARPSDFRTIIVPCRQPDAVKVAPARSFLHRLFDAVFESRQQRAERDIEAYLARTGHRFTDSIERELNDHMFGGGWNQRR
jgi:hypothetical protein